jgi:AraC-like DNA-binding protein
MSEYIFHYLPVNNLMMRWGLYVTGGGRGVIPPGKIYPPNMHPSLYQYQWIQGRTLPEFQIILITDGKGIFESRTTGEIPVEPNSLIFLFPGVWHRYRPHQAIGWTERWISFNGELSHRLLNLSVIKPENAVRRIRHPQQFIQNFDQFLDNIHVNPLQNSILLSLRSMSLLATAIEQAEGELSLGNESGLKLDDIDDPLVSQALDIIWTSSHRILSVNKLIRQLPVTRRTLDRRFRSVLGRTILEEINNCRLARAKRLLQETSLSIKSIAYLAGFPSTDRMRIVFLKQEKITPMKFRRS